MKQKISSIILLYALLSGVAYAQDKEVSGRVTSAENGHAISGVSVAVVGSTSGTQTDESGVYSLQVQQGSTLLFSYVGYISKRIEVNTQSQINVQLVPDEGVLEEVVVTALGITRDKKSLGYAAQEVKGDVLSAARGGNAVQSLSGNVAGAVISAPSSSLGGSTRVILRGIGSLTGENRPLIVIDGIPMDNSNYNTADAQRGAGGRDYGDASFDVNPDDIESINVLKGGPASALYGARGMNGVLLITTKRAKKGRDEITVNSGVAFESLGITPKLQKTYGGGFSKDFATVSIDGTDFQVVDYSADESWGPRLIGQQVLHWDAFDPADEANYLKTRKWVYPKDDYRSFFNTGVGWTNSISLAKSYENTSARLSLSNLSQSGIVPNSDIKRSSVNFGIENKFSDKLTARGVINYVRTKGFNRPEQGYGNNSIGQKMFQWGQTQLDYKRLKNYKTNTGEQKAWNRSAWNDPIPKYSDNYYWIINENTARDQRDRVYGNVELKYDFLPGLYATGNIYADNYTLRINSQVAIGSQAISEYQEELHEVTEMNYEARVHFDRTWDKFSLHSFLGTNRRNIDRYNSYAGTSGGLIVPNLYSIANSAQQASIRTASFRDRINSVFAAASIGYNDLIYIDLTARNDWSSTLPANDNSYFYPSVTGSLIFSQLTKFSWLNFGKLRLGVSQVGNDTETYRLLDVYKNNVFPNTTYLDNPYFLKDLTKLNRFLKPERKRTYETGLEMQVLDRRLNLDFTYYYEETSNLIMPTSVGGETGHTSKMMNAGNTVNKGVEVMLSGVPIRSADFEWTSSVNFSRNRNKVTALYGDLESLNIATAPFKAALIAALNEPYGQIYGSDFIYDNAGNKVVGDNGLYLASDVKNLGSILPDFNAGWRNSFTYKALSLSVLIDMQKGGKFFSVSNMFGNYAGMSAESVANNVRETGIVAKGVTANVERNQDGSYTVTNTAENTTNVTADRYFAHYYAGPTSQNVFDADYVKLREITFGYTVPTDFLQRLGVKGATVSAFARNLATWGLAHKSFDPEMATTGSGNIQGFEGGNLPASRTYGLNIRLQF